VSIIAGVLLVSGLGLAGAVIGSILAVTTISIPANVRALARETSTTPAGIAMNVWPWFWRFAVLAATCAALPVVWSPHTVPTMIVAGTVVTLVYGAAMFQGLSAGPLGAYVRPRMIGLLPVGWRLRLSSGRP
jgi:hypothetical protein